MKRKNNSLVYCMQTHNKAHAIDYIGHIPQYTLAFNVSIISGMQIYTL